MMVSTHLENTDVCANAKFTRTHTRTHQTNIITTEYKYYLKLLQASVTNPSAYYIKWHSYARIDMNIASVRSSQKRLCREN